MNEEIYYLALATNFDPLSEKLRKAWQKYQDWVKVFQVFEKEFKVKKDWEKEWQKFLNLGGQLIFHKDLPERLQNINPAPLALFFVGRFPIKAIVYLGIVGTRRASNEGENIAKNFASFLVGYDFCIISGAAFGIDTFAHLGVLEAQGKTIAVLGEGIDLFFQRRKNLAERISASGAIISEYPPGTPGLPKNFPERNRIIAGLSDAVLLIETPEKSGALITARFALDYGKDIFVIPHSIYQKNYFGGMKLIQKGAYLILSPNDILEYFGLEKEDKPKINFLNQKEKLIFDLINRSPKTLKDLVEESNLTIEEVMSVLTFLEIKKLIVNQAGYFYSQK